MVCTLKNFYLLKYVWILSIPSESFTTFKKLEGRKINQTMMLLITKAFSANNLVMDTSNNLCESQLTQVTHVQDFALAAFLSVNN